MSLPPQDVLDVINELILEITGFQETDENFAICQRYCLSHVVHHTYPFVNRTTVKNLINSYVSRFYGHGYFKVSQELQHQVKSFLSNVSLFEKNPQYDIQWCLLSLLSSLSSNLTVVKHVPELLPIDVEPVETEDINWAEYLKNDIQKLLYSPRNESDTLSAGDFDFDFDESEDNGTDDGDDESCSNSDSHSKEKNNKGKSLKSAKDPFTCDNNSTEKDIERQELCQTEEFENGQCNETQSEYEKAVIQRKNQIQAIIRSRLSAVDIANDYNKWGNISEKFDALLYREGFSKKSQFISELEMMEFILYQFQTGERILLKKGLTHPALLSVTQKTMGDFVDSLQPYFQIVRCLKDFENDIKMAKYPKLYKSESSNESSIGEKSCFLSSPIKKKNISNVLYVYSVLLKKALEPFENTIMNIIENLNDYSLIRMQHDIQGHFFELTSLFYVHGLATKNWKKDGNWICSIRVLSVLYNAIMQASTTKMSFLYLNMFLQCFQIYLDIIDSWISFLKLNDPNNDFIVTVPTVTNQSDSFCSTLEVRPFKSEIKNAGVKEVPILDFISEKMTQVGESLEVLRRMGRFVNEDAIPKVSSYRTLVDAINQKLDAMKSVECPHLEQRPQEKKRSIFTMGNVSLCLRRDNGMGDCSAVGLTLDELSGKNGKQEEKKNEPKSCEDHCSESVYSAVKNPYFKRAFEKVGVKYHEERLNEIKAQKNQNADGLSLDLIKYSSDQRNGVYPYHKIIFESCCQVINSRISFACNLVKSIIIEECRLKSHVVLMKNLLLFNEGYLIQPFLFEFFTQPIVWDNSYSLTLHLRECLEVRYPDLVPSLSASSDTSLNVPKNILEAIDALTINYEVTWPLTLIFTPDVMLMYNKVFRLTLKLKWAHWMLTNLQFQQDKNSVPLKSTQHRLQLLRFWFLSSLNLLNNYFMTQMSTPIPNFDSCLNLREIINVHSDFIDGIHRNCLFTDKAPEIWSLIFECLIPLCIDLEKFWMEGKAVANAKLTSMETTFAQCQLQLSRVMSSLEKVESYRF